VLVILVAVSSIRPAFLGCRQWLYSYSLESCGLSASSFWSMMIEF
jgi:hypothetical protein